MSKCDTCVNKQFDYLCDGCIHDQTAEDKYVAMTNAERIRAMSDEELLHCLLRLQDDAVKRFANFELPHYQVLADWLQQPCEGGAEG